MTSGSRTHSGTAYLDGVRGWASVMVLVHHATFAFLRATDAPLQHRLLHMVGNGELAVHIFFVLSGFVLSVAFLERGRRSILVSLALRRYPRLTIPIFAICLIAFVLMSAGLLFNHEAAVRLGSENNLADLLQFEPSIASFLKFSLWDVYFDYSIDRSYNTNLWTMPVEFIGSMLVFAVLLAPMRPVIRRVVVGGLTLGGLAFNSPFADFFIGILLAEVWAMRAIPQLSPAWRASLPIGCMTAIVALKLMLPQTGAVLTLVSALVVAIPVSWPLARQFFENPISRKLGDWSFPLYLVHPLVIFAPGSWLALSMLEHKLPNLLTRDGAIVATCLLSFGAAWAFHPVERLAISGARRVSEAVFAVQRRFTAPAGV